MKARLTVVAALAVELTLTNPHAAETPTPGFNHKIPEKIMTPDSVKTRIGTLKFVDGVPTDDTTRRLYDHLDFLLWTQAAGGQGSQLDCHGAGEGLVRDPAPLRTARTVV